MKKLSALISLMCVVGLLVIPLPLTGTKGIYNSWSGLYWCETPSTCIHEIGHRLDQEAGWVSSTEKFRTAMKIYIMVESRVPDTSRLFYFIFDDEDFSAPEIYADIFQWSGGKRENTPEIFREFYDWERAKELLGQ